jgi:Asp-tRNA(Asn)/Glu-tRNA(Gln) amidotransferase A subunit family amidase
MAVTDLLQLGISDVQGQIRTRELSPVELVRAYLERIERLNPALNVYLTVMAEGALAAAKAAEQAVMNGEALTTAFVPVALKITATSLACV